MRLLTITNNGDLYWYPSYRLHIAIRVLVFNAQQAAWGSEKHVRNWMLHAHECRREGRAKHSRYDTHDSAFSFTFFLIGGGELDSTRCRSLRYPMLAGVRNVC